jgi:hypothetical protein
MTSETLLPIDEAIDITDWVDAQTTPIDEYQVQALKTLRNHAINTRAVPSPVVDVESLKRDIASELYDQNDDERWSLSWADNRLIDYLAATGRLATIPDNWVLVPKEPTEEMTDKGAKAGYQRQVDIECEAYMIFGDHPTYSISDAIYRAMIAAAPEVKNV